MLPQQAKMANYMFESGDMLLSDTKVKCCSQKGYVKGWVCMATCEINRIQSRLLTK